MDQKEAQEFISRIPDPALREKTAEIWNQYKGLHPGQARISHGSSLQTRVPPSGSFRFLGVDARSSTLCRNRGRRTHWASFNIWAASFLLLKPSLLFIPF
jgi:hypothetical protein